MNGFILKYDFIVLFSGPFSELRIFSEFFRISFSHLTVVDFIKDEVLSTVTLWNTCLGLLKFAYIYYNSSLEFHHFLR